MRVSQFWGNICTSSNYTEDEGSMCHRKNTINLQVCKVPYPRILNTCRVKSMFMRQNDWKRNNRSLNKFPAFYETTAFISFLIIPRHWSLAWPNWLHCIIHFNGPQAKICCGLSNLTLTWFFIFADGYFIVCKEGNDNIASPFSDHSEKALYQTNVYEHAEFKHTAISLLIS